MVMHLGGFIFINYGGLGFLNMGTSLLLLENFLQGFFSLCFPPSETVMIGWMVDFLGYSSNCFFFFIFHLLIFLMYFLIFLKISLSSFDFFICVTRLLISQRYSLSLSE